MNLHHFFDGQQSKENAASAWLATLLDYSRPFRAGFFADIDASLDPSLPWTVAVEAQLDGPCDVTLEADDTFVFIENKIAASAKRQGQFLRYYLGAVQAHPKKRLIGVYLAPSLDTGQDERDAVGASSDFTARAASPSPDLVVGLGWKMEMPRLVELVAGEQSWFAKSGLEAIQRHMEKLAVGRQYNRQREVLHAVVLAARDRLARAVEGVRFARWPSVGQEALYTVKAPVTVFLTLSYGEDEEPPYELHGVVIDGVIRVRVGVSFGLSNSGRRIPVLVDAWTHLVDGGVVTLDDLGGIPLANRKSFATHSDFVGSAQELEELLVRDGRAVFAFLAPYLAYGTNRK